MRLPWSRSKNGESAGSAQVNTSEGALAGAAGDGKVHDLQYWLDSGFLTLPKVDPDTPVPVESDAPVPVEPRTSEPRPAPSSARLAPDG
jgi:hypothetical protein